MREKLSLDKLDLYYHPLKCYRGELYSVHQTISFNRIETAEILMSFNHNTIFQLKQIKVVNELCPVYMQSQPVLYYFRL